MQRGVFVPGQKEEGGEPGQERRLGGAGKGAAIQAGTAEGSG